MVKETEVKRGRHRFVVNAFESALEIEFMADAFEVAPTGIYLTNEIDGSDDLDVIAFVSHPCMIERDDGGERAATREGGK